MMKLIMPLIFMIPLCFFLHYWLFLLFLLLLSFVILISTSGSISHLFINLSYFCGIDLLSLMLILLSLWICSLMIIASEKIYKLKNYSQFFVFMNLILLLALVLTFSSLNFFMFYLFFEISLIPTLFLIIGWGYQPERISAGVYLLFYTLMVSLPMMVAIFYLYKTLYSLEFYFFYSINSLMLYYCINMVFLVKIPMFFLHLWLPKAHVEAPISGSMILAGVMLKLGGYGLLRTMALFSKIGMKLNMYIIIISLVGGVIVSLICLRQSDIKSLIAYSSVAHMGLVLSGTLTMNLWGVWGALVMLLAHGLCSSGLFCLANISYERVVSRSIYLNKGMINLMPSVSLWWFLLCSSNMAAPPSLNLLGEILLINSLISYSNWLVILLFLVSFFSAAYSVFLYSYTQHGMIYSGLYSFNQVFYREYLLLFLHWFPLNIIILKSEILTLWV